MPKHSFFIEDILDKDSQENACKPSSITNDSYKGFKKRCLNQAESSEPYQTSKSRLSSSLSPASLSTTSSASSTSGFSTSSDDNNTTSINNSNYENELDSSSTKPSLISLIQSMQSASAFNPQMGLKNLPSILLNGYLNGMGDMFNQEEQHVDSSLMSNAASNILLQTLIQNLSNEQQNQQQLLNQYYSRLFYLNQGAFVGNNQSSLDYEVFTNNNNKRIKLSNPTPPPLPLKSQQIQPPTLSSSIRLPISIESLNFQHQHLGAKCMPSSKSSTSPLSSSSSSVSTSPHAHFISSSNNINNNNNNIYSLDENKLKANDPRHSKTTTTQNVYRDIKLQDNKTRISNASSNETKDLNIKSEASDDGSSENVSPLDALLQLANSAFAGNRNNGVLNNSKHIPDEFNSNKLSKIINSCDSSQNILLGTDLIDKKRANSSNTSFDSAKNGKIAQSSILNGGLKRKRKNRTAFTANQIFELEKRFSNQRYLSPHDRDRIAYELQLSTAQVITWFQNRRAKQKRDIEELKNDVNAAKSISELDANIDVEKVLKCDSFKTQFGGGFNSSINTPTRYGSSFNNCNLRKNSDEYEDDSRSYDDNTNSSGNENEEGEEEEGEEEEEINVDSDNSNKIVATESKREGEAVKN